LARSRKAGQRGDRLTWQNAAWPELFCINFSNSLAWGLKIQIAAIMDFARNIYYVEMLYENQGRFVGLHENSHHPALTKKCRQQPSPAV
jgi:hypothetical protein